MDPIAYGNFPATRGKAWSEKGEYDVAFMSNNNNNKKMSHFVPKSSS